MHDGILFLMLLVCQGLAQASPYYQPQFQLSSLSGLSECDQSGYVAFYPEHGGWWTCPYHSAGVCFDLAIQQAQAVLSGCPACTVPYRQLQRRLRMLRAILSNYPIVTAGRPMQGCVPWDPWMQLLGNVVIQRARAECQWDLPIVQVLANAVAQRQRLLPPGAVCREQMASSYGLFTHNQPSAAYQDPGYNYAPDYNQLAPHMLQGIPVRESSIAALQLLRLQQQYPHLIPRLRLVPELPEAMLVSAQQAGVSDVGLEGSDGSLQQPIGYSPLPGNSNPALGNSPAFANNPALAQAVAANPALAQAMTGNPALQQVAAGNPALARELAANPGLAGLMAQNAQLTQALATNPQLTQALAGNPQLAQVMAANPSLTQLVTANPALARSFMAASNNGLTGQPSMANVLTNQPQSTWRMYQRRQSQPVLGYTQPPMASVPYTLSKQAILLRLRRALNNYSNNAPT